MVKNLSHGSALSIVGSILVFTMKAFGSAVAVPPIEPIAFSGTFDIEARGQVIQDFWADEAGFFFLLRNQQAAAILHTDDRGREIRRFSVFRPGTTARELRRNSNGEVAVLQSSANSSSLAVYRASDGTLLRESALGQHVDHIAAVGAAFALYRARDNSLNWEGSQGPPMALPPSSTREVFLLAGREGSIIVVDAGSARLSTVRTTGLGHSSIVHAPEMDPDAASLIVTAASMDLPSTVWVSTSPYSPTQGAIILAFDEDGSLQRRLRCSLPAYENLRGRGNPSGQMDVSFMAKKAGELFIVSRLGGHCAFYRLETRPVSRPAAVVKPTGRARLPADPET